MSKKPFCRRHFPQKSVNLSFIITDTKNKSTNLCGSWLFKNDFIPGEVGVEGRACHTQDMSHLPPVSQRACQSKSTIVQLKSTTVQLESIIAQLKSTSVNLRCTHAIEHPQLHQDLQRIHFFVHHSGVELKANLKSISQRCHIFEVAFEWVLN